ncbi:MAG: 1-phosphofructokinase [Tractidigestivibacter sp.]|uniref:1-phosphofructokinase n=1 Tax=Tractidigestivibacter sp. TaxID=2847320 RepID=UPI003D93F802
MIVTVTLNASIDKAYRLSCTLERGSVMRVSECIDNAGGKGLNAARAVATCGEKVVATGIVGGHNGELLCDLLDKDGIEHDFSPAAEETRCCINVLEPDGTSTEFLEPGRAVSAKELTRAHDKVMALAQKADVVTLDGSLPAGVPTDYYATLVRDIKAIGTPVILDTSGERLALAIDAKPTMVKPNTDEIGQILGRKVSSLEEVASAARELKDRGVAQVVVSLGGDGAIMACESGMYRGRAPKIEVVNPVGAGDTMVGAFAVAMARGMEAPEQLRYAMACASANCLSASTGHFDMADAERLLAGTTVERL